jgi:hypothetical protein
MSILAHLVRCQDKGSERAIMDILSASKHKAHDFMCGLFTGPEQRKKPVLSFVREFFQSIDYFVNVFLNYLVFMGQMNRACCVWKVAYENKLFAMAMSSTSTLPGLWTSETCLWVQRLWLPCTHYTASGSGCYTMVWCHDASSW